MNGSELARSLFEGANARDWSAVAALHSDDHVYHDPQGPKAEAGGAGMAAHLAFYVEALEGHWEVHEIADAGTYVTTRWTGHGVHSTDLIGVPATGREFAVDALSLMRIENGLIAEHWCVWDTAGLMQTIGAMPAPASA
jgi:steroid delta-isomerase-like uncharacterized protein